MGRERARSVRNRSLLPRFVPPRLVLPLVAMMAACRGAAPSSQRETESATTDSARHVRVPAAMVTVDHARSRPMADGPSAALARLRDGDPAGGTVRYRVERGVVTGAGRLAGRVAVQGAIAGDSAIVPSHNVAVCRPFTDSWLPSRDGGAGNTVVWLVGVTHGPPPEAPRRAFLTLDGCQLTPRVVMVAAGGTLLVTSRDAMTSRLRFTEADGADSARATVAFTDAGQVVPTSVVASAPGILEVRDDWHPWVRGTVVVVPHPFVMVTSPTGAFAFDGVPPGRYTLLTWHERLGVRTVPVVITGGVETRVNVAY